MSGTILNATPNTNSLGIQDVSTRAPTLEREAIPTHLPLVFGYAKQGPTTPQLVVGGLRTSLFGADSFDLRKQWANHATVLSNTVNAAGNAQMFWRMTPDDAAPPATLRIYADVCSAKVPVWLRDSDGNIQTDGNGAPMQSGSTVVTGVKIKFTAAVVPAPSGVDSFGIGTSAVGELTDSTLSTASTKYPIMDIRVSSFGADGNNKGLKIVPITSLSADPLDTRLLTARDVYPFRMACVARADSSSTAKNVATLSNEQYVTVGFKQNVVDPNTDAMVYIKDVFLPAYTDTTPGTPPQIGQFGQIAVYDTYLSTILNQIYVVEQAFLDANSDFSSTADAAGEKYLVNLFGATYSNGVGYHGLQFVTTGGGLKFSDSTVMYAAGGSDGTMSDAAFNDLVAEAMADFIDPNAQVAKDDATFPFSILYDSGFSLDTKYALSNFIAVRKDTAVVLSPFSTTGAQLSASQESAAGVALVAHLANFPESEYYGTPVCRGMVVGRSGIMIGSQYSKPLPLTIELAAKAAAYMGAGNGVWDSSAKFNIAPANNVTMFKDINVTFTPDSVRNKDWAAGMIWVEKFSRNVCYFPAFKTVYPDPTSVLNSFFTMMGCVELQKVGKRAHRAFVGVDFLTDSQFVKAVQDFIAKDVEGRFDSRFTIIPEVTITNKDKNNGFSWTTVIKIGAAGLKTVQTLTIQAQRIEDLQA